MGAKTLVTGFNTEEAVSFPDNSEPFVKSADHFFSYATLAKIKVVSFTLHMTKKEILAKARSLQIPLEDIWYCYEGGEQGCGKCESCQRFGRALENTDAYSMD